MEKFVTLRFKEQIKAGELIENIQRNIKQNHAEIQTW